jgi:hypothetical protein
MFRPRPHLKYTFLTQIVMLLFLSPAALWGKSVEGSLNKASLEVKNNEIVDFMLTIKNNSRDTQRVYSQIKTTLNLLTKSDFNKSVPPGDSIFIPVKLLIPNNAIAGANYNLSVQLKTADDRLYDRDSCILTVKKNRSVHLFVPGNDILLQKDSGYFSIPIRLENAGNTEESVSVIAKFPASFNNYLQPIAKATLAPFSDTTIYFTKKANKAMYRQRDFQLNISGFYKDGNVFDLSAITIQTATSERSYTHEQQQLQKQAAPSGMIALSGNYLFSPYEYYQLSANNTFLFSDRSFLKLNVDATAWKSNNSRMLLRNTYLQYEHGGIGLIAGNINRNFDLNINGRGAAFYFQDKKRESRLEAGYANSGYNLLGNGDRSPENGNAYWLNYEYHKKGTEFKAVLLNHSDSYVPTQISLLNLEATFLSPKKGRLSASLSLGNAGDRNGTDKSRQGIGLGLSYTGTAGKKINFSSNNYWSSSYFPGQKRGYFFMDERVNQKIGKVHNLWLAFNHYNFQPQPLPGSRGNFNIHYGKTKEEIGFSLKASLRMRLALAINLNQEFNNYGAALGITGLSRMMSAHSAFSVSYTNSFIPANLSLSSENGWYEISIYPGNRSFHSKSMLNLNYRILNLNAIFQQGYYSILEIINAGTNPSRDYQYYSLSANLQKGFFKGRLNALTGLTFSGNSNHGNSVTLQAQLTYNLSRFTSANASFSNSRYSMGNYNMNNFSAGVTQLLHPIATGSGRSHNLEFFVYKDINKNHIFDSADIPLSNQMIKVNDAILITRPDGKAIYKDLPDSTQYEINIPTTQGWYTPQQSILMRQDERLDIPLQRTGKVNGSLTFISDEFSYAVDKRLGGITIMAKGKNGKSFETKTNDKGLFLFYLPDDTYTLYIRKDILSSREMECINNEQGITVSTDQPALINFILQARQRKIETKKFRSGSLDRVNKNTVGQK